ncbi:pilus assembly protein [Methylotenera sp.]|uniref:pilus assembly protein n=1 Tax=Methylotenera sp. TaxID=2051956 RepID=UPI0027180297|nr:PilC/PilY family type IV pilus protein [Methylotenera sp.]MDO9205441.1 PilC/PilY family type IV pilus protein [Methylotenera sp.]MDP3006144.1 PilC/PilY family type IV pilus protein [Methylotenera sp.]
MTTLLKKQLGKQGSQISQYVSTLTKAALTTMLLAATGLFPASVFSAGPVLATKPLSASSAVVKPNLMFVFDTSKSMENHLANDTLADAAQCKAATKDKNGTAIASLTVGPTASKPSNPNTRLTITPSTGFNVGNTVYLAIPGKPEYSGVYVIKAKNGTTTGCISGTEVYTTTVTVNAPYKVGETNAAIVLPDRFNQTSYNPGNPLADPPVAPTNGCSVPGALPANSGNTTADLNLGGGFVLNASGVTTTPSSSCYMRDRRDTNGCKVTTAAPANSGSTTTNYNQGGGFVETAGGVTTTPSSSCYWYDPLDTPIGTFVSCTSSTTGDNSLEVDIASGAPAGALTAADILDARILLRQDDSKCYYNEPPLVAAKVQSLFYDPSVQYVPPPKPSAVGLGTVSPANRLPSMTSANTANWTSVRIDGTRLNASGDPVTNANTTTCNAAGTNLLTCNNTYRAPDGTYDFKKWEEMVYCDTPDRPVAFTSDKLWHESSRCMRNTPANTSGTVNISPRYPYPYPGQTDGGATSPSRTNFHIANVEYQNGQSKTGKNPAADLYAFGERYQFASPFYYNVRAIEYCDSAKLNNCIMANSPSGPFTVPVYVRYCKTQVQATDTSISPNATACQGIYTGSGGADYRFARYGLFERVNVTSGGTYYKYADRTDCSGAVGVGGCNYDEEMTNVANWYAYYRTRMQLMKSAIGRTFNELDKPETPLHDESEDYRIGFITVEGYNTLGNYLPIKDFLAGTNAQKELFFKNVYSRWPAGGTSLRDVLGTVGRIFAGQKPVTGFTATADDPMQHACQANYTLLTTDGYWNGAAGLKVDGSPIGNQDATPTPFPQREGNVTTTGGSHTDTLADVAAYYYNTDIRNATSPGFASCIGQLGYDVCDDSNVDVSKATQRMTTFTLGLGVDGQLNSTGYKTGGSVDFNGLKTGAVRWPSPGPDNGDTSFTPAERATVDDLWHAAINGAESDKSQYFSAKNPQEVIDGVRSALASLGDIKGTASTTALSSVTPVAGDNYAFSARYTTGSWTGNLFARTIDGNGNLSANALWCVEAESGVTPACNPDPVTGLAAKSNAGTRTIYANNSGSLVPFQFANLTAGQQTSFQAANISALSQWASLNATQRTQAAGANLVNYLRGNTTYDQTAAVADNRLFRTRDKILGDIIDSDPVSVGTAKYEYLDAGYSAYVISTVANAKSVYIGANDGMLHAFNSDTGEERWAYVPTAVMPNMWKLADNLYRNIHTNYVNAKMTVGDICPLAPAPCTASQWKTILVSGFGQGGRGYFALDITNPLTPKLLWETDKSSTWDNLGYSYGKPVITKNMSGAWVVLLTSGYNNESPGNGQGALFVLNANSGSKLAEITTSAFPTPSGLAQVAAFVSNPNTNNQAQYVYGGDLLGNLWRFDIDANTVMKLTTLDSGGNLQPITVAPTLTEIDGKRVVFVGTGQYLESADLNPANYKQQSLYAIKDDSVTSTIVGLRANMVQQTLTGASGTRAGSNNLVDWSSTLGWYVDLPSSSTTGERVNVKAAIVSGVLFVPTLIPPTGTCDVSGKAWTNVFNFRTGGAVDPSTSNIVSTQSTQPIAGFYFVFTNPTNDKVALGTDYTGGGINNKECTGLNCNQYSTLGSSGAFVGNRAVWRELVQ